MKIKAKIEITVDLELETEHYPSGFGESDMLNNEIAAIEDDASDWFAIVNPKYFVKGVINE